MAPIAVAWTVAVTMGDGMLVMSFELRGEALWTYSEWEWLIGEDYRQLAGHERRDKM